MKTILKLSAVVFLAVAAVIISFKMYDNHMFYENKHAIANAKTAYNILLEWCEDNGTEIPALADEYRDGKIIDVSADGEGFAHYLHEEMTKNHGINTGYVYIGVGNKDGDDIVFVQWSQKTSGAVTGQHPESLFLDDYYTSKVKFGSFYKHERGA